MKKIIGAILCISIGLIIGFVVFGRAKASGKIPTITNNPSPTISKTKFSMASAPAESLRGIVTQLSGQVNWQSRIATSSAKLVDTVLIQQGENIATGDDGLLSVQFASVSAVMLSADTEVEVIQTLPISVVFNQLYGKAQYSVLADSPVAVRILNALVNIKSGVVTIEIDGETGLVMLSQESGASTIAYNSPEFISKVWDIDASEGFEYNSVNRKGYFR